ncbi:acetyltransferase [Spongiimicrobium salis]|uniref:acetyltransferase n=1 Tax=Spongiimicrobium salis TaxID=1667022 RepID=UPI00374DDFCA
MGNNNTLNILGCVPSLLNILLELAEEAKGIQSFKVYKNIPVEMGGDFVPAKNWNVEFFGEDRISLVPDAHAFYALSVVGTQSKELVFKNYKKQFQIEDHQFINLIHPTSYVSKSVALNNGLQLEPLSTIAACTSIGFCVNVKRNCNIGHHCSLGDFVTINPGVTLSSFVQVGNNTMIGSGTSIKDHVRIGKNTIIGVGSVVVKDIPDNVIAYGNPCIVHRENLRNTLK